MLCNAFTHNAMDDSACFAARTTHSNQQHAFEDGEHIGSGRPRIRCCSSPHATSIEVDGGDDDGDYNVVIIDDNDGVAECGTRSDCSSQGDDVASESSREDCEAKSELLSASNSDNDADATTVTRVFVRKQAKRDHNRAASSSCDRCKSNLNGKLIIRCALCSFHRHLYCFTPPLKQHPAVLEQSYITARGTKVRVRPTPEATASWICESCRQHGHACKQLQQDFDAKPHEHVGRRRTPRKARVWRGRADRPSRQPQIVRHDGPPTTLHTATASGEFEADAALSPVQAQWRQDGSPRFDWNTFCAEKTKRIVAEIATEGTPSGGLVYYSKPFADMKKTALSWMRRVALQKQTARNRELREMKKRLPPKRNVMCYLSESELKQLNLALINRQRDVDDERRLFDDSLTYEFDMSLSRIRRLREPRVSVIEPAPDVADVVEVVVTAAVAELVEAVCLSIEDADAVSFAELVEAVCMSTEDVDVVYLAVEDGESVCLQIEDSKLVCLSIENINPTLIPVAIAATIDAPSPGTWAAVMIQSAVIRAVYKAKQRARVRQRRSAVAEATKQRSDSAAASIRVLRLCVQFILVAVKGMRVAQMKKLLLQTLQEVSEDVKAVDATEVDEDKTRRLAEKRIQRFFLHRVQRYLWLRKKVMSQRVWLWWKRRRAWWRWHEAARTTRDRWRNRASRVIQSAYRRFRSKKTLRELLEKQALRRAKLLLRSWLMARVIKKEKDRQEILALATSVGVIAQENLFDLHHGTVDKILCALGLGLYNAGDFWNAAAVLDRAWKLNSSAMEWETRLALAYSHHMTWYMSYDSHNVIQAYEMYCITLGDSSQRASKEGMSGVDPFVLQDTAIVMMQLENFGGSLRLLARLIQYFVHNDGFSLWLLLAAVQLQQRGEWEQSVEYLTYLQDIPPSPYLERDILSLCAIGLERQRKDATSRTAGREAWSAALRQYSMERHARVVLHSSEGQLWRQQGDNAAPSKRLEHGARWKWDMLNDFAQRAVAQGHYLLACRLMLYMLEVRSENEDDTDDDRSERAAVWWNLADVFRHLGHIDLYVDATTRNHLCVEANAAVSPEGPGCDQDRVAEWRRQAETQARSFRDDTEKLSLLGFMCKLREQYLPQPDLQTLQPDTR